MSERVHRCTCGGIAGPAGECAQCRAKRLAREAVSSPGRPLDAATRGFFEPRLGADLSDVRLHTDAAAAASVGARAYTLGADIVMGGRSDRRLLAHELAHVLQQRGGAAGPQAAIEVGRSDDPLERAAERVADGVMADRDVTHELGFVAGRRLIQRQIQPTCAGVAFDPATERCCRDTILNGPAEPGVAGCAEPTTRDNEYDGCSVPDEVPDWIVTPDRKDNPGGAFDTWFSDPSIHGTQPQSFVPRLPCDVHDKCYQTCGSDWQACDRQLFTDARNVCLTSRQRPGSPGYDLCMEAVEWAEFGLPLGSRPAYDQRQAEYCACCSGQELPPSRRAATTIRFRTGSSTPDQDALKAIRDFVDANAATLATPSCRLTVIGLASKLGTEEKNLELSYTRLEVVRMLIDTYIKGGFRGELVRVPLGERGAAFDPLLPETDDSAEYRVVEVYLETF